MDVLDDACGAQLSQLSQGGSKFPIASHTLTETQRSGVPQNGKPTEYILCYYQMELLPPRIQYHSPQ